MTSCIHHWLLEPPSGPTSSGYCKLCGLERVFENSLAVDRGEHKKGQKWTITPRSEPFVVYGKVRQV